MLSFLTPQTMKTSQTVRRQAFVHFKTYLDKENLTDRKGKEGGFRILNIRLMVVNISDEVSQKGPFPISGGI